MIQFKAVSTTLAFISLLTFQIVTPAYFLPPDAEIVTDYQGHTTEHSAPYLFCESGSDSIACTWSYILWNLDCSTLVLTSISNL